MLRNLTFKVVKIAEDKFCGDIPSVSVANGEGMYLHTEDMK